MAATPYLLVLWAISEGVIFLRDRQPGGGERRDRASRIGLFAAIGVAAFVSVNLAGNHIWTLPGNRRWWMAGGILMFLAGIAFRQAAVRWLGAYFRTRVTLLDDHRLVTDGPYARIRHPSYSGGLLTCAGFGLALGSAASLLAMILLPGAAFAYRIRVEERALSSRFGVDWSDYCRRTAALLPGIW